MSQSRTTNSALAYLTQILSMLVSVLGGFLITPLLIRLLGSERFGIFRMINDWMANLTLLELGIGGAVAVTLIPAIHETDPNRLASTLNASFRACTKTALLMLGGALILIGVLPLIIPHQHVTTAEIRFAVLAFALAIPAFPTLVFRTLFEVRQQGYLINGLITTQGVVTIALQVFAAVMGWGLVGICLATTVGQLPMIAVLTCKTMKRFPLFWLSSVEKETESRIWSVNWAVFICRSMGRVGLFSDNLVIGQVLGGSAVSSFYLTQRFAVVAQAQLQAIGNSTWAGLMDLAHKKKFDRFQESLLELTSIVSGLGLAALMPIYLLNPFFFTKWVGSNLYAGSLVNATVCASAWLWSIQSLWGWPIDASGNSKRFVPYAIVSGVLNLTVSVLATRWLGLAGPIIGTLVTFLLVHSWAMPRLLKSLFQIDQLRLVTTALCPLLWAIPLLWLAKRFVRSFPPVTWIEIVSEAILIGLVSLFLWWRFSCTRQIRDVWMGRFRSVPAQALSLIRRPSALAQSVK